MTRSVVALAVGAAAVAIFIVGALLPQPSTPSTVGTTPSPSTPPTPPTTVLPTPSQDAGLHAAILGLDGLVQRDLRLPSDAWTPDLSADAKMVAFATSSRDVGFCGACLAARYPAVVSAGASSGSFIAYSGGDVDPASVTQLAWSPDGTRIAFQAAGAEGNFDIYVVTVEPELGEPVRLTTDPGIDEFPAWSPDGRAIVYANAGSEPLDSSGFSATQEIWSIPVDGGSPRRLTNNDVPETQPDVARDGTMVYWRGGDIWTMTSNGENQARLSSVPAELGFTPRWSPDKKRLALLRYDPSDRAYVIQQGRTQGFPILDVVVVSLATGRVTDVGAQVASDVNGVSWTPDGRGLLVNQYEPSQ